MISTHSTQPYRLNLQRLVFRIAILLGIFVLGGCENSPSTPSSGTGDASGDAPPSGARLETPQGLYVWDGLGELRFNPATNRWEQSWVAIRLRFNADGQVFWGLPDENPLIDDFDWQAAGRAEPEDLGTWTLNGASLTMEWPDGTHREGEFDGYVLRFPSTAFRTQTPVVAKPPEPVPTLEGTYYSTNSVVVDSSGSSINSTRWLRFEADGKVEVRDLSFFSGNVGITGEDDTVFGSWSLKGYTLTVTPEGGQPEVMNIWRYGEVLLVGGRLYVRQSS